MFAKIFTQILDSSLAENYQVRLVFEDLLKLADINGVVDMTPEAISRRTNVPFEIVQRGIVELEKADPRSRNPEHDGRRIIRLDDHRDWGWMICNYAHYRAIASEEQRREKTRIRVQRHRNGEKRNVTPSNAGNAMQRQMEKKMKSSESTVRPSLEEVKIEAQRIGLVEWKVVDWWLEMEGCNWLDCQHRPVASWKSFLKGLKGQWDADGRPMQQPGKARASGARSLGQ